MTCDTFKILMTSTERYRDIGSPPQKQSESLCSRPDLAWQLESGEEEHSALRSVLQCVDLQCCSSQLTSQAGIPKSAKKLLNFGSGFSINGTDVSSAEVAY